VIHGGGQSGDGLDTEVRALEEGAGLLVRAGRGGVRVDGADRLDYLHRMLTQDLRGLASGAAAYALVLTPEGKILGDPLVLAFADHLLLDVEADAAAALVPVLERTVITEDVVFSDVAGLAVRLLLAGPAASDVLAARGVEPPAPLRHHEVSVAGAAGWVLRRDVGRVPAFELALARAGADAAVAALTADGGARAVSDAAYDTLRVDQGVPAWGHELLPSVMPLEARLEDVAISWKKGCYPGQEPVVMARHRGHPPRLLVRLDFPGGTPPLAGTPLEHEGRTVGTVTTVAGASAGRGARGLGLVRHALARAGTTLGTPDGLEARLADPA
jgi:folate-binding protein YgfZ